MDHVHKYLRVRLGNKGHQVYKCVLGCPHYVRKELLIGREGVCWRCGLTIVMTVKNAEQKKPHCHSCTKKRKPNVAELVEKVLGNLAQ